VAGFAAISAGPLPAQNADAPAQSAGTAAYKPPLRGAPGGRVGGASRSASARSGELPQIELLAPASHAGVTATPEPVLYFHISGPVSRPMQFTISAPLQPEPVVETAIPAPAAAGIYPVRVADYRVRLQPGIVYTWSISIVLDPHAWSRNVVASAPIVFDPAAGAAIAPGAATGQRVAAFAQAGLWYDAVAAAATLPPADSSGTLGSLMRQVGLATQ
jgi:hypothetical protein